nr:hypothetical protein [Tanacetum cinerariifolium]
SRAYRVFNKRTRVVGYSTQSRAYRVFSKRTRVIMESIHVNFDELPQIASDQNSSDPAPVCQTMALEHDSLSPGRKCQENVSQGDKTGTTSNELDLLFSPMFDELLNGSSKVVSKSSAVSAADDPNERQQLTTPLNNHITPIPTCQIPSFGPTVISSENVNQAELHAENDQVADDEFINIFSTLVIGLGYTPMFLTHSDEALEIEKFKRSSEYKIEFAYDYGNLNASYSLKSKGFESSENVSFESENQTENDCLVVEKKVTKRRIQRMNDLLDDNNLFIFDDENVKISPVSKMPFRKKPRDSMHVHSKNELCEKFLKTVRFGNNDFAVIAGYGDVVIGSMTIKKVYYVEGLGDCSSNLYTIALNKVASNSSTCLLAKASSSQSWLWHQRLSHLNFAIINNLVKNNLVQGLPKMKFKKDHLCSACEQGKIHQKHHKSKTAFASNKPLYLLHMDWCGPMRIQSC